MATNGGGKMNSDMKCPFCQQELNQDNPQIIECRNDDCKKSYFMYGSKELWQELIRTRKAFEKAVDGLLAVWRATDHTTKQGSIAYNVLCDLNIKPLDRIKALEQKDVK